VALRSLQILSWLIILRGGRAVVRGGPTGRSITPWRTRTITLTGHESPASTSSFRIARHGAKGRESAPSFVQGAADSFGLILEAQAEGVTV